MEKTKLTTAEKIRIYKSLFTGLTNVYGTYDTKTSRVRQVKKMVTDEVILAHLKGKQSYGVYLLTGDKTAAMAVDFDQNDLALPLAFVQEAGKHGIRSYIERSKSKGYHVWVFFETPVSARKGRCVAKKILSDIGQPQTEIFPKQDTLSEGILYGNFINSPLFGAVVPRGRTIFVDPGNPSQIHPDQWQLLETVRRIPEAVLDAIIENFHQEEPSPVRKESRPENPTSQEDDVSPFGLPPCARKMLADGVCFHQRVSCFRLAVRLKRTGMPYDLTLTALKAWAQKNRPHGGKRIITDAEIEYQVKCAFDNTYRSFGCEEPAIAAFCDPNCRLYTHRVR